MGVFINAQSSKINLEKGFQLLKNIIRISDRGRRGVDLKMVNVRAVFRF